MVTCAVQVYTSAAIWYGGVSSGIGAYVIAQYQVASLKAVAPNVDSVNLATAGAGGGGAEPVAGNNVAGARLCAADGVAGSGGQGNAVTSVPVS